MTRPRDFLGIAAGVLASGTVVTGTKAERPQLVLVTRYAAGKGPRDIFPPGQHPADYYGPAIPDEPDDAALIVALAELDAIERHVNSLDPGEANAIEDDRKRHRVIAPIWEAQGPILERVCGIPARTMKGLQARARTILLENLDMDPAVDAMEAVYQSDRLIAALLRDLLAMGSAADA
jgi:hypothetical protein